MFAGRTGIDSSGIDIDRSIKAAKRQNTGAEDVDEF
jgi:hypothetical protein